MFELRFRQLYIIWISDDIDGVLLDDSGKIKVFKSKSELLNDVKKDSIPSFKNIDVTTYDISKLQQWVLEPNDKIEYEVFLNFWNLCTDISQSIKVKFTGDYKNEITNNLYKKLFDGGGPSFTSEDPSPIFNYIEIIKLSEIIQDGLMLLMDNLSINN